MRAQDFKIPKYPWYEAFLARQNQLLYSINLQHYSAPLARRVVLAALLAAVLAAVLASVLAANLAANLAAVLAVALLAVVLLVVLVPAGGGYWW